MPWRKIHFRKMSKAYCWEKDVSVMETESGKRRAADRYIVECQ